MQSPSFKMRTLRPREQRLLTWRGRLVREVVVRRHPERGGRECGDGASLGSGGP